MTTFHVYRETEYGITHVDEYLDAWSAYEEVAACENGGQKAFVKEVENNDGNF